jgi:nucleotide-binding universal stress UspA family protein
MLRTILVGLDGSHESDAAFELGLRWAKRHDALLVGMGIVDEPGIRVAEEVLLWEPVFRSAESGLLTATRHEVSWLLGRYALRCVEMGVAFKELQDEGSPGIQIALESHRFDLLLLGQRTHFRLGWEEESNSTLREVLEHCGRPIVSVPDLYPEGNCVVVAYDGSPEASRALAAFEGSGLASEWEIHVVSYANSIGLALRAADRAVDFLQHHRIRTRAFPVKPWNDPVSVVLDHAQRHRAALVVAGVSHLGRWSEWPHGAIMRRLLAGSTRPVFLYT